MYIVYGKNNCGFCKNAVNILQWKKVAYEYIKLEDLDHEFKVNLVAKYKINTVPIILYNDELIGGIDQLREHFSIK